MVNGLHDKHIKICSQVIEIDRVSLYDSDDFWFYSMSLNYLGSAFCTHAVVCIPRGRRDGAWVERQTQQLINTL